MRQRARLFLKDHPEGATAEVLAREVLGIRGATSPVAERLVASLLDGAPGFIRESEASWRFDTVASPDPAAPARAIPPLLVVGTRARRDPAGRMLLAELAGNAPGSSPASAFFHHYREDDGPLDLADILPALVSVLEQTVVIAYRPGELLRPIAEALAVEHGLEPETESISLARLARRIVPEMSHRDLDELAAALGLSHYASDRARDQCELAGHVMVELLRRAGAQGEPDAGVLAALVEGERDLDVLEGRDFDDAWLDELPETPGIYRMFDADGRLLYVGKARNLRRRVRQYFQAPGARDERVERILAHLRRMEYEETGSELLALLAEEREIRERRPVLNVQRDIAIRTPRAMRSGNLVVVVPGAMPDACVMLFVQPPHALGHVQVPREGVIPPAACEEIRALLRREPGSEPPGVADSALAGLEIARSWLHFHRAETVVIDLEAVSDHEQALRVLGEARASLLPDAGGVEHR